MAIYNRDYCESYFQKVRQLSDPDFVRMWFLFTGLGITKHTLVDAWLVEWHNMAPWNKQQVLFLMATEIDRIARAQAMKAAAHARVEDP